jgi:UDP:flavonoid glycosyltransferase YjiC (YdhE family)
VNLKTGTPTADAIAAGVQRVLGDRRYRERARALATRIREMDTFGIIAAELEAASLTAAAVRVGSPLR